MTVIARRNDEAIYVMQEVYCVGEAAQLREGGFIAGQVKACTMQAHIAIPHLLGEPPPF